MTETTAAKDAKNADISAFGLSTVRTVAIGSGNLESETITDGIVLIRVWPDVDCHVVTGSAPEATTSLTPLTAKVSEYFKIKGGLDKVSVIRKGSDDGTLYITEMI